MSERSTTSCCYSLLYSVQKSQSFVNTILIHCFDCCQYQQLKIVNVDTNVWKINVEVALFKPKK